MAKQCEQLRNLLVDEGLRVSLVQTNRPFTPAWIENLRFVRAFARLIPYVQELWRVCGQVEVIHLLANSGWAWHFFAAPVVWIARLRGVPVIVNYRGGDAQRFFYGAPPWVRWTLAGANARVVPSGFLRDIFDSHGLDAEIIPNVVDLGRFRPVPRPYAPSAPHTIVTRNLEAIYGLDTALHAFAELTQRIPGARMTLAGEGPELNRLRALARDLGIADRVFFSGRLTSEAMAQLYRDADAMLNPSTVDNMPNSILEAYASGVPVVSTDVGGIPYMAQNERTALLVAAGDAPAMAAALHRVFVDRDLAERLVLAGLNEARRYTWSEIRHSWLEKYRSLVVRISNPHGSSQ